MLSANADSGPFWTLKRIEFIAKSARPGKPRRRRSPNPRPAPPPLAAEPKLGFGKPVPFLKRRARHCACVLDERGRDGLALFCGAKTMFGKSWCPEHYARFIDLERMTYGKTRHPN